jgi:hypothetical protein
MPRRSIRTMRCNRSERLSVQLIFQAIDRRDTLCTAFDSFLQLTHDSAAIVHLSADIMDLKVGNRLYVCCWI